jgi:TRAP-type transport system periplasmic protein
MENAESRAYDLLHNPRYGIGVGLRSAKLLEFTNGSMIVDQFPGAQLGQQPRIPRKIRTGDIDFIFSTSANAATIYPHRVSCRSTAFFVQKTTSSAP